MTHATLIRGINCNSFVQTNNKFILKGEYKLFVIEDWIVVKKVQHKLDEYVLLSQHLILPTFSLESLPFTLVYKKDSIALKNVLTGHTDDIILGSANNLVGY